MKEPLCRTHFLVWSSLRSMRNALHLFHVSCGLNKQLNAFYTNILIILNGRSQVAKLFYSILNHFPPLVCNDKIVSKLHHRDFNWLTTTMKLYLISIHYFYTVNVHTYSKSINIFNKYINKDTINKKRLRRRAPPWPP